MRWRRRRPSPGAAALLLRRASRQSPRRRKDGTTASGTSSPPAVHDAITVPTISPSSSTASTRSRRRRQQRSVRGVVGRTRLDGRVRQGTSTGRMSSTVAERRVIISRVPDPQAGSTAIALCPFRRCDDAPTWGVQKHEYVAVAEVPESGPRKSSLRSWFLRRRRFDGPTYITVSIPYVSALTSAARSSSSRQTSL